MLQYLSVLFCVELNFNRSKSHKNVPFYVVFDCVGYTLHRNGLRFVVNVSSSVKCSITQAWVNRSNGKFVWRVFQTALWIIASGNSCSLTHTQKIDVTKLPLLKPAERSLEKVWFVFQLPVCTWHSAQKWPIIQIMALEGHWTNTAVLQSWTVLI